MLGQAGEVSARAELLAYRESYRPQFRRLQKMTQLIREIVRAVRTSSDATFAACTVMLEKLMPCPTPVSTWYSHRLRIGRLKEYQRHDRSDWATIPNYAEFVEELERVWQVCYQRARSRGTA